MQLETVPDAFLCGGDGMGASTRKDRLCKFIRSFFYPVWCAWGHGAPERQAHRRQSSCPTALRAGGPGAQAKQSISAAAGTVRTYAAAALA